MKTLALGILLLILRDACSAADSRGGSPANAPADGQVSVADDPEVTTQLICADTYSAVCGRDPAQTVQRKFDRDHHHAVSAVQSIMVDTLKDLRMAPYEIDTYYRKVKMHDPHDRLMTEFHVKLWNDLHKRSLVLNDVIEEMKQTYSQLIDKQTGLSEIGKKRYKERLQTVHLESLVGFAVQNGVAGMENYYRTCGYDGTGGFIRIDRELGGIIICPGSVLDALNSKSANTDDERLIKYFKLGIAHEIGHMFDLDYRVTLADYALVPFLRKETAVTDPESQNELIADHYGITAFMATLPPAGSESAALEVFKQYFKDSIIINFCREVDVNDTSFIGQIAIRARAADKHPSSRIRLNVMFRRNKSFRTYFNCPPLAEGEAETPPRF